MSTEVADFIDAIALPWQRELVSNLRQTVLQAIPEVDERLQYKKPHFLKNGHYAAVISTAKGQVSFTIFNVQEIEGPDGFFEESPPERKTVKFKEGQTPDLSLLEQMLARASSTF